MHVTAAMGNRYRRRRAEQSAALQWRNLGPVRLVVTSKRIMLLDRGQWGTSTDHAGIRQVNPDPRSYASPSPSTAPP